MTDFFCKHCDVSQIAIPGFPAYAEMQAHIRSVHLQWHPYECIYCEVTAFSKQYLEVHITQNHPGKKIKVLYNSDQEKEKELECLRDFGVSTIEFHKQPHRYQNQANDVPAAHIRTLPADKQADSTACLNCSDLLSPLSQTKRNLVGPPRKRARLDISLQSNSVSCRSAEVTRQENTDDDGASNDGNDMLEASISSQSSSGVSEDTTNQIVGVESMQWTEQMTLKTEITSPSEENLTSDAWKCGNEIAVPLPPQLPPSKKSSLVKKYQKLRRPHCEIPPIKTGSTCFNEELSAQEQAQQLPLPPQQLQTQQQQHQQLKQQQQKYKFTKYGKKAAQVTSDFVLKHMANYRTTEQFLSFPCLQQLSLEKNQPHSNTTTSLNKTDSNEGTKASGGQRENADSDTMQVARCQCESLDFTLQSQLLCQDIVIPPDEPFPNEEMYFEGTRYAKQFLFPGPTIGRIYWCHPNTGKRIIFKRYQIQNGREILGRDIFKANICPRAIALLCELRITLPKGNSKYRSEKRLAANPSPVYENSHITVHAAKYRASMNVTRDMFKMLSEAGIRAVLKEDAPADYPELMGKQLFQIKEANEKEEREQAEQGDSDVGRLPEDEKITKQRNLVQRHLNLLRKQIGSSNRYLTTTELLQQQLPL